MIGIISDTHDNIEAIRKAVAFFNSKNVDLVLHAGDLVSPFTFKEFNKLNCKFYAVFGNNDGEKIALKERFKPLCELKDFLELEFRGLKICVYHGTFEEIVRALVDSRIYDVVIRGHTHQPKVEKFDKTLEINPGECCGYLTGKKTIAILDEKTMNVEIIEL